MFGDFIVNFGLIEVRARFFVILWLFSICLRLGSCILGFHGYLWSV